ncbi:MAG: DUF4249 domain-containing protein [Chitinophagales bacterium]|nr:DUF4249 domain-containing protein [Chitinophagales bacterium]
MNIFDRKILVLSMLVSGCCLLLFSSCTKDLNIDLPPSVEQLVVEGHISTGQFPYVILSRTTDYYSTFYLDSLDNLFVHDALVKVSNGSDTITLPELTIDTGGTVISVYLGLNMIGEEGKTYSLWIEAEGKSLSAITTIPVASPLDSIWWEPSAGGEDDSLVRLICRYTDPPLLGNYVRYFTQTNSGAFNPGYNSVFEDAVINGTSFEFPLDRGVNRNDSNAFDNYGLFKRGDTITVAWDAIDLAHFDFWRTLEFELGSQGSPFATPVTIQGNIEGGAGIWGGYSPTYKTLIVPPQ